MAQNEIDIQGTNENEVYSNIVHAGVSKPQATELDPARLLGNAGRTRRTFAYQTDFPATEADCTSHFHRTFAHRDWRDGEDLVQAEQSSGEDGFNLRFHRIENDLDALGADVAEAFLCLGRCAPRCAPARRAEGRVNMIEGDLADLKSGPAGGPAARRISAPKLGTTSFLGSNVDVFQDPSGQMILTRGDQGHRRHRRPGRRSGAAPGTRDELLGRSASTATMIRRTVAGGGNPVTKQEVLDKVGSAVVDGTPVSGLIDILPDTAKLLVAGGVLRRGLPERGPRSSAPRERARRQSPLALELRRRLLVVADAVIEDFQMVLSTARTAPAAAGARRR